MLSEECHALPDGIGGLHTQLVVAVVADRMRDHDKRVVGHSAQPGHDAGGLDKPIGDDGSSRDAELFSRDRVVQTARRAAPSVPDP